MFGWLTNLFKRPSSGYARRPVPAIFRYLPIHRIRESFENAREQTNLLSFEELRDSIAEYGILVPVIVRPEGAHYTLIAGHRRVAAARDVGLTEVPAMVRRVSTKRASELAVVENAFRLDLTKLEMLRAFEHVAERHPTTPRAELAAKMGIDPEALESAAYLSALPEDLQQSVEAGLIGEEHAMRLADVGDEEARIEMVELIHENRIDHDETRGLVDRMLRRDGRFVTAPDSRHFHAPECAFARMIPDAVRRWIYSKKEGLKLGKIACMNCL